MTLNIIGFSKVELATHPCINKVIVVYGKGSEYKNNIQTQDIYIHIYIHKVHIYTMIM